MCHDTGCTIPYGLCHCGCGKTTTISPYTRTADRIRKGEPRDYIRFHQRTKQPPLVKRFWPKVVKTDTCWIWKGTVLNTGYGQIWDVRKKGAHVVSWELAHGQPVPKGSWVLHRCDNRRCVRPDHLFLGGPADNVADMLAKGRGIRGRKIRSSQLGEAHHAAKLRDADVLEIRKRFTEGETRRQLARSYGVGVGAVEQVISRKTWRHLP